MSQQLSRLRGRNFLSLSRANATALLALVFALSIAGQLSGQTQIACCTSSYSSPIYFSSAGNVGIGTASPSASLQGVRDMKVEGL